VVRRSHEPKTEHTPEEWADLRRRAERGDTEALFDLNYLHHNLDHLAVEEGDLQAQAERAVIKLATTRFENDAALSSHLAHMRLDLDGPAPSAIDRVLVDRVVTCWLFLSYLDARFADAFKEGDVAAQKHLERLVDGANGRYLSAIRTLAQVRRLLVPVVQVNMANQQVNVVTGSTLGELGPA
jgi:hypothetical protein